MYTFVSFVQSLEGQGRRYHHALTYMGNIDPGNSNILKIARKVKAKGDWGDSKIYLFQLTNDVLV